MTGFQLYATVILIAAVAVLPIHFLAFALRQPRPALGDKNVRRYGGWERLVHLALLFSFLVLACTGFYASIAWGGPMTGYMLMLHTTSGAVFAVTMAIALLTWAADHGFSQADGRWLAAGGCLSARGDLPSGRFNAGDKIYFWMAGVLTLVALMSMLLSMIKVLGQPGQALMYETHRWSTLVMVVATIWHAYATTLAKPGGLTAVLMGRVTSGWVKRYHPLWGSPQKQG
jgi:formate dehydrogenase subunit gamma